MVVAFTSLIVSSVMLVIVTMLFSKEARRGLRYLESFRAQLDFRLLKIRHSWNVGIRNGGRYFVRQIIHYFFHTILAFVIRGLEAIENRLKSVARTNRALARKSERERTSMNMLDEVALHKLEVALTEEEKKLHKRQSIEG